jgi:alpha-glucosidase
MVRDVLAKWPDEPGIGWPSWAFENHDAPRALSRWATPEARDAYARMKAVLFAALRGNIIVYQGEELGLTQVDIPFELLQDPEAIANWPLTLSRDGAAPRCLAGRRRDGRLYRRGNPLLPLRKTCPRGRPAGGRPGLDPVADHAPAPLAARLPAAAPRQLRCAARRRSRARRAPHARGQGGSGRAQHERPDLPWPEGLPPHAAVPHTAVLVAENGAAPGAPLPAYAALIVEEPA